MSLKLQVHDQKANDFRFSQIPLKFNHFLKMANTKVPFWISVVILLTTKGIEEIAIESYRETKK